MPEREREKDEQQALLELFTQVTTIVDLALEKYKKLHLRHGQKQDLYIEVFTITAQSIKDKQLAFCSEPYEVYKNALSFREEIMKFANRSIEKIRREGKKRNREVDWLNYSNDIFSRSDIKNENILDSIDLLEAIEKLDETSKKVLRLRMEGKTLKKIGEELGLPFQRISEIIKEAIIIIQSKLN